ncbi:Hypothetical protein D9617_1g083810 [Elsinoe fawcettii]|nr:Hypothetical protein D9617_1g083810 [Elsinoe fawcettii]
MSSCSICHSSDPKYRCPTHPSIQTCSLPCYKKHKLRASCTGQRNATSYVKKSALTTPEGFDHDFNFLSAIERGIAAPKGAMEEAEREAKRRKTGMGMGGVEAYCARNGIKVEKAPVGFERARRNETRFLRRSKKVSWTVEWVGEEGERWWGWMGERERVVEGWRKVMKETGAGGEKAYGKATEGRAAEGTEEDAGSADKKLDERMRIGNDSGPAEEKVRPEASDNGGLAEGGGLDLHKDRDTALSRVIPREDDATESTEPEHASRSSPTKQDPPSDRHFYLHVPRSQTAKTVLIPLDASSTITECLSGRHILEFPTLYALAYDRRNLPEAYITETEFKKVLEQEYKDADVAQIVRSVSATVGRKGRLDGGIFGIQDKQEEVVDKERILEMLRRDLKG